MGKLTGTLIESTRKIQEDMSEMTGTAEDTLKNWDLIQNRIREDLFKKMMGPALTALTERLPLLINLEFLFLKSCSINSQNLLPLLSNLPQSMQILDLSSNQIDDDGAMAIIPFTKNFPKLKIINLFNNDRINNKKAITLANPLIFFKNCMCLKLMSDEDSVFFRE
jgi:hypothetical protein